MILNSRRELLFLLPATDKYRLAMIFYFSGTGNSAWCAARLAGKLGLQSVSVAEALAEAPNGCLVFSVAPAEPVIFVFPVHSWGPALVMRRFMERMELRFAPVRGPVCFVATCGDDAACTDRLVRRLLQRRGIALSAGYALRMPNNYILMAGFGTDAPDVERAKLEEAPDTLDRIAARIREGGVPDAALYARTGASFLKSYGVYPLFRRFKTGRNAFRVTDACVGCGFCARICPVSNIRMEHGRPVWDSRCVECVACIHRCPERAVEYGRASVGQGRYVHPDLRPCRGKGKQTNLMVK